MKILIACEESGTVRDAFSRLGHDAWSCDLKPARNGGNHYQGDVFNIIDEGWDMMIAHPPCTYLTLTANKWLKDQEKRKSGALVGAERREAKIEAAEFFMKFVNADVEMICIENPLGAMSTLYRKPDQIIHPYMFGDEARKSTCLWLKNLPKLFHASSIDLFNNEVTHVGQGELLITKSGKTMPKWYAYADSSNGQQGRAEIRSKTFKGIANAMASQWSEYYQTKKAA